MSRSARVSGVITVETALLLPAFLLLIFGALEFSRLLWVRSILIHACNETVRYAMVRGMESGHHSSEAELMAQFLGSTRGVDAANLRIYISPDWHSASTPGTNFRVTAQYDFVMALNLLPAEPFKIEVYAQRKVSQ